MKYTINYIQKVNLEIIIYNFQKMEQIKQLTNAIDQATSDSLNAPNLQLYSNVQRIIVSRADMPKHCIIHVSKRIMIKNKKVILLILDLLEYLSYKTELSFYIQIATKDFLLKISGLLQSKDFEETIKDKILSTIRCWEELFKPHQDLLPMFFQFYDGLIKKGFDQKKEYISAYRPNQLKKYPTKAELEKKVQKKKIFSQNPQKIEIASTSQNAQKNPNSNQTLGAIREQVILTNQIIDGCDPAQGVKGKSFLNELLSALKESEKSLTKIINQSTNQKIMEQAIALNDDLIITYRRYKELQKNKKPEPFIKTELNSNFEVKQQISPPIKKVQNLIPVKNNNSLFQQFEATESHRNVKIKQPIKQSVQIDILNLDSSEPKNQNVNPNNNNNNNGDILNFLDFTQPASKINNPIQFQPVTNPSQLQFNTQLYHNNNIQPELNFNINPSQLPNQQSMIKPPNQLPVNNYQTNQSLGLNNQFAGNNNFSTLVMNSAQIPSNQPIRFGLENELKTEADLKTNNDDVNNLVDLTDLFSKKL